MPNASGRHSAAQVCHKLVSSSFLIVISVCVHISMSICYVLGIFCNFILCILKAAARNLDTDSKVGRTDTYIEMHMYKNKKEQNPETMVSTFC